MNAVELGAGEIGIDACEQCLRRSWLLKRLAGHLEVTRGRIVELLALEDPELISALAGAELDAVQREWREWDATAAQAARTKARALGMELICRCEPRYPAALCDLEAPPAVLYVAGGMTRFLALCGQDPVAIVGSRQASRYAREVACELGRGVCASGLTVVSGMANGIDAEAHLGALGSGGQTIAVLPGPAYRATPAGAAALHRRIVAVGVAVSELPPGVSSRSWMYLARNRIIAGLSRLTVVVEARARSGALATARVSGQLGRRVVAVPGQVTNERAEGSNALLVAGARLIRGTQDLLDEIYGVGVRTVLPDTRPAPTATQATILMAITEGLDTAGALAAAGVAADELLAEIAGLELGGRIRRAAGGRLSVVP